MDIQRQSERIRRTQRQIETEADRDRQTDRQIERLPYPSGVPVGDVVGA